MIFSVFPLCGDSSTAVHLYTEDRPWGNFTILDEQDCFKIKRIEVNTGRRLSLQSRNRPTEHWVIVAGA